MRLEEKFKNCKRNLNSRPFWAWNCEVGEELIEEELPIFQKMGMGGFTIHSRTGLQIPFMGEIFQNRVSMCEEYVENYGMKIWLYDDDRWPSGYGGGFVTEKQEYRARYLVISTWRQEKLTEKSLDPKHGRLDLRPNGHGEWRAEYEREEAGIVRKYYVYEEQMEAAPWFNHQAYVDTMNPEAIQEFVKRIYEPMQPGFEHGVEAVFTDEPQVIYKRFYEKEEQKDGIWVAVIPFQERLKEKMEFVFQDSFWNILPKLLWDITAQGKKARYWYHRICMELFAAAFCDQLGNWCLRHGTWLAGHLRGEESLKTQVASLGEAMRHYQSMQIPGIDILCNHWEYNTLKQCQSVVHQMGKQGMAGELYGVTGWDFPFSGHKLQGDWTTALGVTHRVHHLAWMSMEGEAKRDFPASIFYQLPWYHKYKELETYFGRLALILQQGTPVVKIGVLHPVESAWMVYGVEDEKKILDVLEQDFSELTDYLLENLLDFDLISEALLENLEDRNPGFVGQMEYSVILVPEMLSMRGYTEQFLTEFLREGGRVIFLGNLPYFCDGEVRLWNNKEFPGAEFLEKNSLEQKGKWQCLQKCLEEVRDIEILDEQGDFCHCYLYQMRKGKEGVWLFFSRNKNRWGVSEQQERWWKIRVRGEYSAEQWDAERGCVISVDTTWEDGWTCFCACLCSQDSLLMLLKKNDSRTKIEKSEGSAWAGRKLGYYEEAGRLCLVDCLREEDNVAVLSQAEFRFQGEMWEAKEELLRLEERLRKYMCYSSGGEYSPQPWAVKKKSNKLGPKLELAFTIESAEQLENVFLGIENPQEVNLFWDGEPISILDAGWYVDKAIRKVLLPVIEPGLHRLVVKRNFNSETHLEWCYLLGKFQVCIQGTRMILEKERPQKQFGPINKLGMPFYGGNLIYRCVVETTPGFYLLELGLAGAALFSVRIDGEEIGIIGLEPGRLELGMLSGGKHDLEIIAYGMRTNTFGPIHNKEKDIKWYGPGAWRSKGEDFTYEWNLRDAGLLDVPKLLKKVDEGLNERKFLRKVVW